MKLKIQHAFWNHEIPVFTAQSFGKHEIMLQAEYSFLDKQAILYQQLHIIMHYNNGALPQPTTTKETLLCRSLLNGKDWLQPLAFSNPHRDKLELKTYGRQHFCDNFDSRKEKCLSLPYLLFLDGFGLYRNSYRSLMGVYLMLTSFGFNEQMRRANVIPLTLGPHGSNLNDVLDALLSLRNLDRGGELLDLPQPTRVCIFPLCTIRDMPQQQANAGFKSQRANFGCWFCLVPSESRGDLDYDVVKNGRFHFQTMQQRREMSEIRAVEKRETFASK